MATQPPCSLNLSLGLSVLYEDSLKCDFFQPDHFSEPSQRTSGPSLSLPFQNAARVLGMVKLIQVVIKCMTVSNFSGLQNSADFQISNFNKTYFNKTDEKVVPEIVWTTQKLNHLKTPEITIGSLTRCPSKLSLSNCPLNQPGNACSLPQRAEVVRPPILKLSAWAGGWTR
uniref:Uncharacterized protein n=1 Tax=Micrurus corallinus TaxID=54390 RepID=A0A2D4F1W3_MICCO